MLALLFAIPLLSGCDTFAGGGDAAKMGVPCNSQEANQALRQHVLAAASQSSTASQQIRTLLNYLQTQAMSADPAGKPQFDNAVTALTALAGTRTPSGSGADLQVAEVTDRGADESGNTLCWASISGSLAEAPQQSLDQIRRILLTDLGIDDQALGKPVTLKLFYSLARTSKVVVADSDLSEADAYNVSELMKLGEAASLALAPIAAAQQRKLGLEREIDKAEGAMLGVGLDEAKLALREYDSRLNEVWRALDEETRRSLLAEQRVWIRRRAAVCDLNAKTETTDPAERALVKTRCLANETLARLNQLSNIESGY